MSITFGDVKTVSYLPLVPDPGLQWGQSLEIVAKKLPMMVWEGEDGKGDVEGVDPIQWKQIWETPITGMKQPKPYHLSLSDEHGTPQPLFDRLNDEFHFDLDVCATAPHEVLVNPSGFSQSPLAAIKPATMLDPGNAKCPIYFDKEADGLSQHWFGRVWMNPPFTKGQVGKWVEKLVHELVDGRIDLAVALVAARPDTKWWEKVATYASEIRFLKGRLTFEGNTESAPFPSAVCIFDPGATEQTVKFWSWQTGTANMYWKSHPVAETLSTVNSLLHALTG